MPGAVWSRLAEEDLREIFRYIAFEDRRFEVARQVVQSIPKHCDKYAELSAGRNLVGTDRSDLSEGIREFSHQRWVVLFRPIEGSIRVLGVFDGSREFAKLFQARGTE